MLKDSYLINPKLSLSGLVAYGGYGRLNIGTDITLNLNSYYISMGTANLNGVILPKHFGGLSIYMLLYKRF